ncbi:DEAD/DEAH box helicase [Candidatus Peregrinibacteria bacterium]|nr:DEAD/DEAH box helicase [Candidatus Peregrinibacteria bacterium]MBT4055761.1 DEAD/DEAH box helicase [Candidatus Peregrinibacteria bacterium]
MNTFNDMGLNPMILQALAELNFEEPTPIQSKTIPHLISSEKDLIALAQTGTGKTAAYSLPMVQRLADDTDTVQALILCPTRELAIQISNDIEKYMKYMHGAKVTAVFGGERIDKQIRALKKKPQIVVGTPGRVNDMINRRVLKVESLRWLVLDEADEMLNMGFKEELDEILKNMPEDKQVLLFSATMDKQIRRIASNYMKTPEEITVGSKNKGAENVKHFYYVVHEKDRYQALRRIADMNPDIHGIVFCRTRRETQQVADKLMQDHYSAEAIHGDISQAQRTTVMNKFRDKKIQLLVATDVAARGIDVQGLTHIVNYTLPETTEAYLHRSGRTGRAHNLGSSLVIVNMREQYRIRNFEGKIGKPFEKMAIPTGEDVCEKQLFGLIDKIIKIDVNEEQIGKYLNLISKKFENMDREEMIKKFVSAEFNRFLDYYKNAADLNSRAGTERSERSDKSSILFARFKINVGRNEDLNLKDLFQFMNSQPELRGVEIGNINLNDDFTLVEVDQKFKEKVMTCFSESHLNGIEVEISCEETGIRSSRPSRPPSRGRGGPSRGRGGPSRGRGGSSRGYRPQGGSRGGSHKDRPRGNTQRRPKRR